ncbi:MAG: hypothetical protein ACP5PP_02855 [Fervidobacterium sp.]
MSVKCELSVRHLPGLLTLTVSHLGALPQRLLKLLTLSMFERGKVGG